MSKATDYVEALARGGPADPPVCPGANGPLAYVAADGALHVDRIVPLKDVPRLSQFIVGTYGDAPP